MQIARPQSMQKRVGIYLRVSTMGQDTGLQRAEIEQYLIARGWTDWTIYEDRLTGTNAMRPGLRSLLKDARERKLDVVVCWKICRLARSLRDLVSTLQDFSDLGIAFISLKDQIDLTTASGKLLTHLLGSFAEFEASLIRERVVAGLSHAKQKGVKLGRPSTISGSEVQRLRQQGLSLQQIAAQIGATKGAVSKTLKKLRLQDHEITGVNKPKIRVENTEVLETPEPIGKSTQIDCPSSTVDSSSTVIDLDSRVHGSGAKSPGK